VAFQLWRYCPHTQLDGIDIYYRADHPQTDFKRTASGRIGIGLSARDTHWAPSSFQFAHEFCHGLANYSNNPQRWCVTGATPTYGWKKVFVKRLPCSRCEQ